MYKTGPLGKTGCLPVGVTGFSWKTEDGNKKSFIWAEVHWRSVGLCAPNIQEADSKTGKAWTERQLPFQRTERIAVCSIIDFSDSSSKDAAWLL